MKKRNKNNIIIRAGQSSISFCFQKDGEIIISAVYRCGDLQKLMSSIKKIANEMKTKYDFDNVDIIFQGRTLIITSIIMQLQKILKIHQIYNGNIIKNNIIRRVTKL